jgi:uncharacterized protein (TIGR00369 family)
VTPDELNRRGAGKFPGYLGIVIVGVGDTVTATLVIEPHHMAPNGYLHAGTVVTLADTAAGYGCISNLPDDATGFTTIELKSNFVGTARDGTLECSARAEHAGRTTQVWAATVAHRETGRTIALFRCTQLVIYPN